ncbi:MAG: TonB family protein [Candidatus Velthaea sp.]|jgi:TonB family protein
MRSLAFTLAATLTLSGALATAPRPARANVFCPVTIGALQDLGPVSLPTTYGIQLDFDPGLTSSVRVRIDTEKTRYAVDFDDVYPPGTDAINGFSAKRYFALPEGEHVQSAWVQATGTAPTQRLDCPITQPYDVTAPVPTDPRIVASRGAFRRSVLDAYSTRTKVLTPIGFGPVEARTCAQAYAPPRAVLPAPPVIPVDARAQHVGGAALVQVDLDETSSIVDARVIRSSGFASLDAAARDAALKSQYRTETYACRSIASSYRFVVTFAPQ